MTDDAAPFVARVNADHILWQLCWNVLLSFDSSQGLGGLPFSHQSLDTGMSFIRCHVQVTCIGDEAAVGPSAITSISLTPDGEYLLANLRSHTGHLWRVGPVARRIAKPLPEDDTGGPYGMAPEGKPPHAFYWDTGAVGYRTLQG